MEGAAEPQAHQGPTHTVRWARGLAGAAAGGAAGYLLCGWLAGQGFYGVALPGVLLGLGAGWWIGGRSKPFSLLCGAAGLALGIVSEWAHFPFTADGSLGYFLRHISDLQPVTLILIALGALAAYWFAWRARRSA